MVTPYQDLTLPFGGVTLWMNSSHPEGVLDKNWFFAPPLPQTPFGVWNPPPQVDSCSSGEYRYMYGLCLKLRPSSIVAPKFNFY